MSTKEIKLLNHILDHTTIDSLLDSPPPIDDAIWGKAKQALDATERIIGEAAQQEYFLCSKERFLHLIAATLVSVETGSRILDVGNAPGYLAIALNTLGYNVKGINLNDEWNKLYPDEEWLEKFSVQSFDVENPPLPFMDGSYDAIVFTEVLEHIAITNPAKILADFYRLLNSRGVLIFSTPNVCNLSNIYALLTGINVFWPSDIFYGSTDRHNREFTPSEVMELFLGVGFDKRFFFGINDWANWRIGTGEIIIELLAQRNTSHPLLMNTIMGVFSK